MPRKLRTAIRRSPIPAPARGETRSGRVMTAPVAASATPAVVEKPWPNWKRRASQSFWAFQTRLGAKTNRAARAPR